MTATAITLEAHICDQRRSYHVTFSTEAQAVAFIERKSSTHAFQEIEAKPLDYNAYPLLYDVLYPTCEHGMSLSNCSGPQHFYFDEEEQARGFLNG